MISVTLSLLSSRNSRSSGLGAVTGGQSRHNSNFIQRYARGLDTSVESLLAGDSCPMLPWQVYLADVSMSHTAELSAELGDLRSLLALRVRILINMRCNESLQSLLDRKLQIDESHESPWS